MRKNEEGVHLINYDNFPHIFYNILDNLEITKIKEIMDNIYENNLEIYNKICADRREFEQIRGLDTKEGHKKYIDQSAWKGQIELIRYLHERGYEWNYETMLNLASGGYLECLKYMHNNGCKLDVLIYTAIVSGGYLECLKYSYENIGKWGNFGVHLCSCASGVGQLECLKYLHENECEWNSWTLARCKQHVQRQQCLDNQNV